MRIIHPGQNTPIKVRVLDAQIHHKAKSRLNFTIQDSTATRRGVVWGPTAQLMEQKLKPHGIYRISNYIAKQPMPRFNPDPVEFTFTSATTVLQEQDDEDFAKKPTSLLKDVLLTPDLCDISCKITNINHTQESPNKRMVLRHVHVVDTSAVEVSLVLYKDVASSFEHMYIVGQSINVTNVRRSQGSVPTLTTTPTSCISLATTPLDINEFQKINQQETPTLTLAELQNQKETLPVGIYPISNTLQIATFAFNQTHTYYGCNRPHCRQKLLTSPNNILLCRLHGPCTSPRLFYHVGVQLMDTEQNFQWLSLFDNHMSQLMPTTAAQFASLNETAQRDTLSAVCGSSVKITVKLTKQNNYTNINVLSISTV